MKLTGRRKNRWSERRWWGRRRRRRSEWRCRREREQSEKHTMRMRHGCDDVSADPNLSHACARMNVNHCEKWTVWGVVFTPPVGCSRLLSAVDDLTATNQKSLKFDTSEVVWRNGTTGLSVLSAALYMSSVADFLVNCHELDQESFHCHQDVLDEEDDGCHFWYCQ